LYPKPRYAAIPLSVYEQILSQAVASDWELHVCKLIEKAPENMGLFDFSEILIDEYNTIISLEKRLL
jgi:hypothetical protein